ncbi:MAG: sensor histidine kinase [Stenotrophobium sp.]
MERIKPKQVIEPNLIPDFCSGRMVFSVALAMELVALTLTLLGNLHGEALFYFLALVSLYLQWIGLCGAAALCWSRRWLTRASPQIVFFSCWAILVLIVVLISDIAYIVATLLPVLPDFPSEPQVEFVFRNASVAAIVSLLLLRYFWSRSDWQQQVRAEGESRYQALNARIQPHFLFNSLNSIAAMIAIKPTEAETMVVDLSDLFRASMEKRSQVAALSEEVALVQAYLRIEKARLGDKLHVHWDIPDELLVWRVPKLVIQPLVENAVHHGVSRLLETGVVAIRARETGNRLVVEVENPVPPEDAESGHGNRIAIDNIAQRLQLIYGDNALLELGRDRNMTGAIYRARLSLPLAPRAPQTGDTA